MNTLPSNELEPIQNMNLELERLIDEYGNQVLKVAHMYLKDKHRAEDAFQEVFIKVYKNFHTFKGQSSEKTWIISITANVCKDILKNSWLKKVILMDYKEDVDTSYSVDNEVIQSLQYKELYVEVMKLPLKYKEPLILYYYQEMSTVEISQALDLPEGTVRTRLHRGRELLKQKISGRIEFNE